jgi:Fe-S-cluster containining protein
MVTMLHDLAEFYEKLDQALQPSKRVCGTCGECCVKASMLRIYPLELENIKRYVNNESSLKKFLDFANNVVVKIWGNVEGQCPFQTGLLCSIYPVRPYFCRIYGHYDYQGKNLLDGCVYRGHATVYTKKEELPLLYELEELSDTFASTKELVTVK